MTLWKNDHLSPWQEAFKRTNNLSLLLQRECTGTRTMRRKILEPYRPEFKSYLASCVTGRYLNPLVQFPYSVQRGLKKPTSKGLCGGGSDEIGELEHQHCAWGLPFSSSCSLTVSLLSFPSCAPSSECKHLGSQNPTSRKACRSSSPVIPKGVHPNTEPIRHSENKGFHAPINWGNAASIAPWWFTH